MPLVIHHLEKSQSERILFLCEELGLEYDLVKHDRNPETGRAQEDLSHVHWTGTAPVMVDNSSGDRQPITLAESAAIVEYISQTHGGGRLVLTPKDQGYADYLSWFHYSNGTLQPSLSRLMMLKRSGVPDDSPFPQMLRGKWDKGCKVMNDVLGTRYYLAGDELTAADIMVVFTLTTMRGFCPMGLGNYPNLLSYLERIGQREGYKRAMKKGDPELTPMLAASVQPFQFGKR